MSTEQLALQALYNILTDLKDSENKPIFRLVEEFYGQYEDEEGNPLWDAPAALIEMVGIDWQDDVPRREQYGLLNFRIHIVSDTGYEDTKRRLATTHHTKVAYVAKALRNLVVNLTDLEIDLEGILMNKISRTRTEFVNELSENVVTVLNFDTLLVDYSAIPQYAEIMANYQANYYLVANEEEFLNLID